LQYRDPADRKSYGTWPRRVPEETVDPNWREFVGCTLILIREAFSDRLPKDLLPDLDEALLRAAEGAAYRDVGPGYSNIAIMSALLMEYVGAEMKRSDLCVAGKAKAKAVYERFKEHETFDEFNSPTYYGVDLMGLAMWRHFARSPEIRAWAEAMEETLWRDMAAVYHAEMRNLAGPYVRAYGMDMMRYYSLAGLWIAIYLDDPERAPWPDPGGMHSAERAYAPLFMLLNSRPPEDVAEHFTRFVGPREVVRKFAKSEAHIRLERDIMIGAARMDRAWEQHHPATVHWLDRRKKNVYWIALAGTTPDVEPRLIEDGIAVVRTGDGDEPIVWWVNSPFMEIAGDRWVSDELVVTVECSPGIELAAVRSQNSTSHHAQYREVIYRVPKHDGTVRPFIRLHLEKRP
ncbi:MAG: hypothetical protein D6741_08700, partial [Planctomycetota bacterium]